MHPTPFDLPIDQPERPSRPLSNPTHPRSELSGSLDGHVPFSRTVSDQRRPLRWNQHFAAAKFILPAEDALEYRPRRSLI
jgi:hypothetical protein